MRVCTSCEKFCAENDMVEECIYVLDVLRVLGKGQSHNNIILLQNLTEPLMGPQLGYIMEEIREAFGSDSCREILLSEKNLWFFGEDQLKKHPVCNINKDPFGHMILHFCPH